MKKTGLVCALAALMLVSGSGRVATVSQESFAVTAATYEAGGTATTAKSGTVSKTTTTAANTTATTKTSTAKASTATKTTSGTTATKSTTTTKSTTPAKVKVGEKTWKTQMIVKEFWRDGKKIYGEIYRPVGEGIFPGIIIAHGFNANCNYAKAFAKELASMGVVAYVFDFIGGGNNIKSGGSMTDMSVLTEANDFNIVFNGIRSLSYVDEKRMFVMGESQGGFVATYIAGTRPNDVKGLIALYPAYNLQNDSIKLMLQFGWIPDRVNFLGCTLSRKYFQDLVKFDIYKVMSNFKGKAVLVHGTADDLVPLSVSQKAVKTMSNAKLYPVNGAGHGFGVNNTAKNAAISLIKELSNK
ncbi:MAG: alpha/beta hydrolase [Butyrivibrio sp.]|nr:alpha/beta hydrolase [Butyrivibrio sp.]